MWCCLPSSPCTHNLYLKFESNLWKHGPNQVTWLIKGIDLEQTGNFKKCIDLIFIEHLLYVSYDLGPRASEQDNSE